MSQRGVPIWGILLIFVGLVLILQTFSILPWGLWFALIRMWPVLLIVLGVNIILSGRSNWIAGVLVAVLFGASLGIAFWQYDSSSAQVTGSHVQSIEGVHTASIDIRFSFGGLEVSNLPETSDSLAEVNTESGKHRSIKPEFVLTEGRGELVLSTEGATRLFSAHPWSSWDARLATQVPLTLTIDASAADINIDLRALQINELYIDVVASNCLIRPPSSGNTSMKLDADLAHVQVIVPPEVDARIGGDTTLGSLDVDTGRFVQEGEHYVSKGFGESEHTLHLEVDCDLGRVRVK